MLDVQYRMHPAISRFPAMEFYDLALQDGTVDSGGKALPGLEPPRSKHMTRREGRKHRPSVIFLDHTGNESFQGRSVLNLTEAHIVASIVEDLLLNNKVCFRTFCTAMGSMTRWYFSDFEDTILGLSHRMQRKSNC